MREPTQLNEKLFTFVSLSPLLSFSLATYILCLILPSTLWISQQTHVVPYLFLSIALHTSPGPFLLSKGPCPPAGCVNSITHQNGGEGGERTFLCERERERKSEKGGTIPSIHQWLILSLPEATTFWRNAILAFVPLYEEREWDTPQHPWLPSYKAGEMFFYTVAILFHSRTMLLPFISYRVRPYFPYKIRRRAWGVGWRKRILLFNSHYILAFFFHCGWQSDILDPQFKCIVHVTVATSQ